jgi:acetyltransferase-like isoleucine patch superfamily enzyme
VNPLLHLAIFFSRTKVRLVRRVLAHRICYQNPTLVSDPTATWDYGYSDIDAIKLGKNVSVGPFTEIVVYKSSMRSSIPGSLTLGDHAIISAGACIRAAGGAIIIGNNSGIAQNCVLVASTHKVQIGLTTLNGSWDESKSGITIGQNVWVGACSVIMPGVEIGDNSVVGAGSVVTSSIPADEIWVGAPARFLKKVSA